MSPDATCDYLIVVDSIEEAVRDPENPDHLGRPETPLAEHPGKEVASD
jgi:hypothetical protein